MSLRHSCPRCRVLPFLVLLLSCASGVLAMYEDERTAALASAAQASRDWQPQVRVMLSDAALDGIVQTSLADGLLSWKDTLSLSGPLGLKAQVTPSADIDKLSIKASHQCDGCLDVRAHLVGTAAWSAAGRSGRLPFTARLKATVAFDIKADGDVWAASGSLRDVESVKLGSAQIGTIDASALLGDWVQRALSKARPMDLGSLGGSDLPLLAARLSTETGSVELQLLTDLPSGSAVTAASKATASGPGGPSGSDFQLRIAADTALALARRAAFEQGAIAMDVAAIPTSLTVQGSQFTMGLRLWKLTGAGWWRDYEVVGDVLLKRKRITLSPTKATEGEKSRGAGLADPLALLAEGRILSAVEEGLHQALPASAGTRIGGRKLTAQASKITGEDGVLILSGTISQGQQEHTGPRTLRH